MKENKKNHKNKWMQLPRTVVVGHGVINDTGKVCKDLKLNGSALMVAGSKTLKAAGKTVAVSLEDSGFNVNIGVVEKPNLDEVSKVEKISGEVKASFLLGVGGGKSIDIAKLVSMHLDLPFISVPTAATIAMLLTSTVSAMTANFSMATGFAVSAFRVEAITEEVCPTRETATSSSTRVKPRAGRPFMTLPQSAAVEPC